MALDVGQDALHVVVVSLSQVINQLPHMKRCECFLWEIVGTGKGVKNCGKKIHINIPLGTHRLDGAVANSQSNAKAVKHRDN